MAFTRSGGRTRLLDAHQVRRRLSLDDARQLVQRLFADPRTRGGVLDRAAQLSGVARLSTDRVTIEQLAHALASGRIVFVEESRRIWIRPEQPIVPLLPDEPDAPLRPQKQVTWIAVEVVHELGFKYPRRRFDVTFPDGTSRSITTDDESKFRFDDVPRAGSCRVIPSLGALALSEDEKRGAQPTVAESGDVSIVADAPTAVQLSTGARHRIVVREPRTLAHVEFVTDRGTPLRGIRFRLRMPTGEESLHETDSTGVFRRADLRSSGPFTLVLEGPIPLPPAHSEPLGSALPVGLEIERTHAKPISLATNEVHRVVVRRPMVRFLYPPLAFGEDRSVLLFDDPGEPPDEASRSVAPRATVRAAVRTLFEQAAGHVVMVAGHTDSIGKDADNESLAERRARNVELYLHGDREAWATHSATHATHQDVRAMLLWAARVDALDCEPGEDVPGALRRFRAGLAARGLQAGPLESPKAVVDDWAAVFDACERELARIAHRDGQDPRPGFAPLPFAAPALLPCGERRVLAEVGVHGFDAPDNRRVDVLLFPHGEVLPVDPPTVEEEVYGGTFRVEQIAVPEEGKAMVVVLRGDRERSPGALLRLRLGSQVVTERADEHGEVVFTILRREVVEVLEACSLDDEEFLVSGTSVSLDAR